MNAFAAVPPPIAVWQRFHADNMYPEDMQTFGLRSCSLASIAGIARNYELLQIDKFNAVFVRSDLKQAFPSLASEPFIMTTRYSTLRAKWLQLFWCQPWWPIEFAKFDH